MALNDRLAALAKRWTRLAFGDPTVEVSATNPLPVTVTGSSGSSTGIGAPGDTAATTDTGTFSLIALFKRLLQKLTAQLPAALVGGRLDVNVGAATVVPVQAIKTVAATGTPEALVGSTTQVQSVTLVGIKAARTNNTGIVYLGIGNTNDSQILAISPGERVSLRAAAGRQFDLANFYLDVLNAGDGVGIIYS